MSQEILVVIQSQGGESGASLVEYALLIAFIVLAAASAVRFMGENTSAEFEFIGQCVSDLTNPDC